jgi:hypothetical protein
MPIEVDPDALICALVLAPRTYSRNRYFSLYQAPAAAAARRRAARIRGVVRQLLGHGGPQESVVGERILEDGRVLLRYRIATLGYQRTMALSAIEAAALHYALHRAGAGPLSDEDRALVEGALRRLGTGVGERS